MKLKYILPFLLFTILGSSCKKENEIDLSDFDVNVESYTFTAGEEVTFRLNGNPSQISFYSGETGNSYDFRNKSRVDEIDELIFQFETHNTATELVDYTVLVSSDFNGVYDYENVSAATWKDIGSRFNFADPAPWQTNWESSGQVNISDVPEKGKPFYIAFKYNAPEYPVGSVPSRGWRTRAHKLDLTTQYGYELSLATFATMGWTQVKADPEIESGSVVSSSIMLFSAPRTSAAYEEWGISQAFNVDEIDMGVDRSIPIKGYSDLPITEYKHIFSNPGTYRTTFVATNKTAYNDKEIVKHIDITINAAN